MSCCCSVFDGCILLCGGREDGPQGSLSSPAQTLHEHAVIVKASSGPRYVVGCRSRVDKSKLVTNTRVTLDMTTLTIMRALPREVRGQERKRTLVCACLVCSTAAAVCCYNNHALDVSAMCLCVLVRMKQGSRDLAFRLSCTGVWFSCFPVFLPNVQCVCICLMLPELAALVPFIVESALMPGLIVASSEVFRGVPCLSSCWPPTTHDRHLTLLGPDLRTCHALALCHIMHAEPHGHFL